MRVELRGAGQLDGSLYPRAAEPGASAGLAKLNSLQAKGSGGLDNDGNASGYGVTSQGVPASLYTALNEAGNTTGYPTYISVILSPSATAASVGVEQR